MPGFLLRPKLIVARPSARHDYNFAMDVDIPAILDIVDDDMAMVLREKTPAERLAIGHAMWRHARQMMLCVIRRDHPHWSEVEVEREVARRLSHGAA